MVAFLPVYYFNLKMLKCVQEYLPVSQMCRLRDMILMDFCSQN